MCYMANRKRVGVREIRQNLSVYLDRVKAGEALEITEHGTPVAVLAPLPERATLLQRLVSEGRATAPTLSWDAIPPPLDLKLERPLSEILSELREERL
jgi:prevent-host-death family protein